MTEAAPQSAALARAGACARASKRLALLLQRFAIVLMVIVFASAVGASGRWSARLIAAAFDAPTSADSVARAPGTARTDLQWEASSAPRAAELKAVELDGADGDEPLPEHTTGSTLSCAPVLAKPAYVLRGAWPADTSRFAGSPRLPRGPPVSIG